MTRPIYARVNYHDEYLEIKRFDGLTKTFSNFEKAKELEKMINEFTNELEYKIIDYRGNMESLFFEDMTDIIKFYDMADKWRLNLEFIASLYDKLNDYDKIWGVLRDGYKIFQMEDGESAKLKFEKYSGLSYENRDFDFVEVKNYSLDHKNYYLFYNFDSFKIRKYHQLIGDEIKEITLNVKYYINTTDGKEEVYLSPNGSLCIAFRIKDGFLLKHIKNVSIDNKDNLIFSIEKENGDDVVITDKFYSYYGFSEIPEYKLKL